MSNYRVCYTKNTNMYHFFHYFYFHCTNIKIEKFNRIQGHITEFLALKINQTHYHYRACVMPIGSWRPLSWMLLRPCPDISQLRLFSPARSSVPSTVLCIMYISRFLSIAQVCSVSSFFADSCQSSVTSNFL